ncbi:hypothetical protein PT277_01705 [Acetobacteraceae bacterium ESL0709]|nr:hypothetical protein [Acetobacteraceae bacterium ESL0697]MDF7677417.1 hypothetical protein [Acetobacteraceae bacterium ESL0709]
MTVITVSTEVDVDVDLSELETDDLIRELNQRETGKFINNKLNLTELISDCWRAFEKQDRTEFDYLMNKLKAAGDY